MAKHMLVTDSNGRPEIVFSSDAYPYCSYVECRECGRTFCDNGCDPRLGDECPEASALKLFDVDARGEYVY